MEKTYFKNISALIKVALGKAALALALPVLVAFAAAPVAAQTALIQHTGVYQSLAGITGTAANADKVYCGMTYSTDYSGTTVADKFNDVSFYSPGGKDPYKYSALIEYDKPFNTDANITVDDTSSGTYKYPNHCLSLCMDVYCVNPPTAGSTYSIGFPIQDVRFDIVKYYDGKNVSNPEDTPPIRTIDIYPMDASSGSNSDSYMCSAYKCYKADSKKGITCADAKWACDGTDATSKCYDMSQPVDPTNTTTTQTFSDALCKGTIGGNEGNAACMIKSGFGKGFGQPIHFCAAWDGSYEIAGEYGKTNGNFAFRAHVGTKYPGDNVTVDNIEVDRTISYPGMNQIPIQIDVTNVHTVRSTPTVIGTITGVAAEPYTLAYRLSKDAEVKVGIFDATEPVSFTEELIGCTAIGSIADETTCVNGPGGVWTNINGTDVCCQKNSFVYNQTSQSLRRILENWAPKVGEGMRGQSSDKQLTEFSSWDGRDDKGRLLPAGNYIAAIQARTNDEWPGTDFSRAVTRQLSLDPLKLTDLQTMGLNKQSTAYATISYVATEPSTVYWNIYAPGTQFTSTETDSSADTGTYPTASGTPAPIPVYTMVQERGRQVKYTERWDGLCAAKNEDGTPANCTLTYAKGAKQPDGTICSAATCSVTIAHGAPLPDGNYVSVLWAEIPYTTPYCNATYTGTACPTTICTAGTKGCFNAVKTIKYDVRDLPIERGLVGITIEPVNYSTIGSSPTAYGLDPFMFKFALDREAQVKAYVQNTAGLTVKTLTPGAGQSAVAQQLNTFTWDGVDDYGRVVGPGTYMFVVEASDAMFPEKKNKASAIFPVDMYRVVDVRTTDVYGDSEARATISYSLSKAMNVQINIYNKDVVIPNFNVRSVNDDYMDRVGSVVTCSGTTDSLDAATLTCDDNFPGTTAVTHDVASLTVGTVANSVTLNGNPWVETLNVARNPYASTVDGVAQTYNVTAVYESRPGGNSASAYQAWPPTVCHQGIAGIWSTTDGTWAANSYVVPSKINSANACIYVNNSSFTNYPTAAQLAQGNVDVRLQPIHTFDRSATRPGEGLTLTEEWDALYFYNPSSAQCKGQTDKTKCKYEMVPDGQYPYYLSARTNEPADVYYAATSKSISDLTPPTTYVVGAPFVSVKDIEQKSYLYATDRVTDKINVTRGPVYFLDGSTVVYPNAPQLFNASSGPVFIPPYEINFAVSRASTVEVAIVALDANMCSTHIGAAGTGVRDNRPGDVCKFLSTTTVINTGSFDPNVPRKVYWDGTDNNGYYVKPGIYEVRLTARNYPDPGLYQETVKRIPINADLMKVFDLLEADGYSINQRDTDVRIGYQISVPMKVAIQIFKPGTTIYDYQKGTLRNPATGQEVKDINEVLVRSIVGIRPATTLIEELWDGRDYAQQEVPDGTYPFRFVTAVNSADIDTITGAIVPGSDDDASPEEWKVTHVADANEYRTLHKITVAIGDGRFVCEDWEKTVFFYPNPLRAAHGTVEITKMPVPGTMSIKLFTLDGTLIRNSGYTCVDANNTVSVIGDSLSFSPDNTISNTKVDSALESEFMTIRNAALRCKWDKTNQHGKKVARGVYFGVVDFKAQNGREHCQKVLKILIP